MAAPEEGMAWIGFQVGFSKNDPKTPGRLTVPSWHRSFSAVSTAWYRWKQKPEYLYNLDRKAVEDMASMYKEGQRVVFDSHCIQGTTMRCVGTVRAAEWNRQHGWLYKIDVQVIPGGYPDVYCHVRENAILGILQRPV